MNSEPSRVAPVLSAHGVGKFFRRYASRWHQLLEIALGIQTHQPQRVFSGLSFDIHPGEGVAIIGRNGAGKSTLLKLLTQVQQPSEGRIQSRGRIAAILELGVGLHPDFTGRQNARLLGMLQGLSPPQTEALMPAVEDFAEIGGYFDQPIHTYSTGMQMRLAFSVATVAQPDVLIVDEALAVGDVYFQHKCYARIREIREQGAAVLFVSHDPSAVRALCSRALLLHEGRLVHDGPADDVLEHYNALLAPEISRRHLDLAGEGQGSRSGSGEVRIQQVDFWQNGLVARALHSGAAAKLLMSLAVHRPVPELAVGISIRDRFGNELFGTNTFHQGLSLQAHQPATLQLLWELPQLNLGPGDYSLTVAAHAGPSHHGASYDWWDRCLSFQVMQPTGAASLGPCAMPIRVQLQSSSFLPTP